MSRETAPTPGRTPSASLLRRSTAALAVRVAGAGMAFATSVLLARWLGQEAFGEYAFAVAIVGVLAMLARAGFGTSLLRFHGEYRGRSRPDLAVGVTATAVAATAGGALVLGLGLWIWTGQAFGDGRGSPTQNAALVAACWLIPVYGLLGLAESSLLGLRRTGLGLMVDQLWRPLLLCGFLAFMVSRSTGQIEARTAILADAAAGAIALGVAGTVIIVDLRRALDHQRPGWLLGQWIGVSLPLLAMSGLQVLLSNVDVLMLGILVGPAETGAYAAASRVARLVLFGLTAIGAAAAPMIAEHHHTDRRDEMKALLRWSARALFGFTIVALIALLVAGRFVLRLFGPGFEQAYLPLVILLAGQAVNSLTGPVAYLLTMTGHQRIALVIVAICTVLCGALNAVLIPAHGIAGAAWATAIAVAASNLMMLSAVRRRLGLNPTLLGGP